MTLDSIHIISHHYNVKPDALDASSETPGLNARNDSGR